MAVHVLERAQNLQLLHILGEVPAGQALVHVLVAGEGVELLDAGLDVVAGDELARRDRVQVNLFEDPLVVGERLLRHGNPELGLGAEHREPELALEDDLVLGRPELYKLRTGIAVGEDIGETLLLGSHAAHYA